MLVFSLFYVQLFCITSTQKSSRCFLPLSTLLHIPYKFGPLTNCILVYEWFYNLFYHFVNLVFQLGHLIPTFVLPPSNKYLPCHPLLSLHRIFFFIYIFINIFIVTTIHAHELSLLYLSIIPFSLLGSSPFFFRSHHHPFHISNTIQPTLPSITNLLSNHQKLCYLSAWQSTASHNMILMKFSNDKPICVDTGASCCISNDRQDFLTFALSTSTILQGIGSGLSISGTGTIKWTILDDSGDEVTLHLHNGLYVPDAPMCL
jgi:hypothetical protein